MFIFKYLTDLTSLVIFARSANIEQSSGCKITAGDPGWPAQASWDALNQTVSGRLIAPFPAGAVCHPDRPEYNDQSCSLISQKWLTSSFHASQPASVDYNDDTCPPKASSPCSQSGYPAYVLAATNKEDVQEGVKFAHRNGVRLIVKGTGHDIPSRSSGRGALSIWTHNIRSIDIGKTSAKIAAGMRVHEILTAAAEKSVTIVTGSDPGVGIGGWITGGGHGPLSSRFGLGADQVLSMEIVTANGSFLQVDKDRHSDLFWALRGGGGSTFAIVISVTVRVYPSVPYTQYLFAFNTTSNSDTFWNVTATFHSHIPSLSRSGAMGYYWASPLDTTEPDPTKQGKLYGILLLPFKNPKDTEKVLAPLEFAVSASHMEDKVYVSKLSTAIPSFSAAWVQNSPESVGVDVRLGSRLLDEKSLDTNLVDLSAALRRTTPPPWTLLGHIVAGPGPAQVSIPGGSNAVLPAWRKAFVHVVMPRAWATGNSTQEDEVTTDLRDTRTQALRDLAPDSGAYVNEADPTEPNWQETFWGAKYARLLQVKRTWDPDGVFWCRNCVGSEDWDIVGGDAIGQHEGKICRKTKVK